MRRSPFMHSNFGLALATTMLLAAKSRKPRPPTEAELKEQDERTERQRWNDEVDARKAAKKGSK